MRRSQVTTCIRVVLSSSISGTVAASRDDTYSAISLIDLAISILGNVAGL